MLRRAQVRHRPVHLFLLSQKAYPVVLEYLKGKHDCTKWVKIPSDVHTPADAAEVLKMRGG